MAGLIFSHAATCAKVNLADVAAVTTVTVNLTQIKDRIKEARAAAKAAKKVAVKAAKKVAGKQ